MSSVGPEAIVDRDLSIAIVGQQENDGVFGDWLLDIVILLCTYA